MATTNNTKSTYALYVGDLAPDVAEVQLFETFGAIGDIVSVRVCRDLVTNKSLGYGYVNYASADSAEKALKQLNFTPIKGRPCRVMRSNPEPTKRRTNEGNLVVKNLDKSVTDRAFFEFFSERGTIASCKISKDLQGQSRGYGFVHFEKAEDAQKVLEEAKEGKLVLAEKTLEVEQFVNRAERIKQEAPATNLYIKNFPPEWTKDTIHALFSAHGALTSVHLSEDAKGRKFAFVNFENAEHAQAAIAATKNRICLADGGVKNPEDETEEEKAVAPIEDIPIRKDEPKQEGEGEEEEAAAEEKKEEEEGDDSETKIFRLYVARAQSRAEREAYIKSTFQQLNAGTAPARPDGVALYVKNLPEHCTKDDLKELFSKHGEVVDVYVALAHPTPGPSVRICRGFGVVTMKDKESATKAMSALHNLEYHGKPLHVCPHQKREERARMVAEQQANFNIRHPNPMMGGHPFGGHGRFPHQQGGFPGQPRAPRVPRAPHHPAMGAPINPMMVNPAAMASYQQFLMQQQLAAQAAAQASAAQAVAPQNVAKPDMRTFANSLPEAQRREYLGNLLYPRIAQSHANEAAKITGMILEMDSNEILEMLEQQEKLDAKIKEALTVLQEAAKA